MHTCFLKIKVEELKMFRKIEDFVNGWKATSDATLKIFNALSDDYLSLKVYVDGRTLGRIAWHITLTLGEMLEKIGIETDLPPQDSEPPKVVSEIVKHYQNAAIAVLNQVEKWNDENLLEEVELYGEKWTKGFTLLVLIHHEIHHRGQLTVLMRQAGLKVPGIFGPSKEEWNNYGMSPQE
jgi:uncharacterized damage-inducible protein DinB